MTYYNENDPKAAAWLRELISRGLIAPGIVDERSILDVRSTDLSGYAQCHFFAGIGGWSYALRLAGWPDDRPVWTGSCPCQPFSAAGKGLGTEDPRHLWPEFRRLIKVGKPAIVFGEQVASKAGRGWLAGVRLDLEALGYGVGAADLCAAGSGAPHIRQRLYWVADAGYEQAGRPADAGEAQGWRAFGDASGCGATSRLANANGIDTGAERQQRSGEQRQQPQDGRVGGMVYPERPEAARLGRERLSLEPEQETGRPGHGVAWSDFEVIGCADGKARRTQSGLFPLAHGIPARMGRLRGYGNAIVPQCAQAFIEACCEVMDTGTAFDLAKNA